MSNSCQVDVAQKRVFEHDHGNFFDALILYNDDRTAPLFKMIETPEKQLPKSEAVRILKHLRNGICCA